MRPERFTFIIICLCALAVPAGVQSQIPLPPRGTLVISCKLNNDPYQKGKIYVDGRWEGNCPGATVRVGTGTHSVRVGEALGNNRYLVYENEQVEVLKDSTQNITARLAPSTGEQSPSLAFALNAKRLSSIPPVDDIKQAAFSPDAKTIAIGAETNSVRLYNAEDGRALHRLGEAGPYWVSFVTALAFSADGSLLASSGWLYDKYNGEVNIWDVKSGRLLRTIHGVEKVSALALSPDGKLLAAGVEPNTIKLWNVQEGKLLWSISPPGKGDEHVNPLIFSADGQLLISGQQAGENIYIYDVLTAKHRRTLPGTLAALAHTGRLITSISRDEKTTQRTWSLRNWELLETKQLTYISTVWGMSEQILVLDSNGVALRNVRNGQVMLTLEGHFNPIAFSANGSRLLFYADGGYAIWSLPAIP